MSVTVTITSARQLAGLNAAVAQTTDPQPTPQEYLQGLTEGQCEAFRVQFAVDRITSSAFVARFTEAEKQGIATAAQTDPVIDGFMTRVYAEPYVWLASDEVVAGMDYLVAQGLLTVQRKDEILAY